MVVLGIESSCDETSAAVVVDGREVRSNVVASQIPIHARYGGVVPELASRAHVLDVIPVIEKALAEAAIELRQVDGIAVTSGPGLIGSLLVGIEVAKALAFRINKPLVGVNHVEAHLMAPFVAVDEGWDPPCFPALGLAVSGGHTSLVRIDGYGQYQVVGQTRDDAAGEALDKVGKALGLGYPGGVFIDRLGASGNPSVLDFPRAMRRKGNFEFSFSGLKTSVMTHLGKLDHPPQGEELADLCASVQEAVVDVLVYKAVAAAKAEKLRCVLLTGGVSANRRLRTKMMAACRKAGIAACVPPRSLCTDNAGMVAGLGFHALSGLSPEERTGFHSFDVGARSSWPVGT